ncbi:probable cation-transporting ATPase 13A2, partial [Austrofundulus limnaeus]|uniref:Probable cation-transporting ATPase 13A2 n=1 Tax=Austrofundulus limnaeus TaxID=52670 RepID=A0A2I4AK56_AUSLI
MLASMFGKNLIDVPVKSCMRLLFEEVLNPFYVFQVFSLALWISDNYYYYAGCIIVISMISISVSLYETRKQSITLRDMALFVTGVKIHRESGEEDCVSSVELVPGDCLIIPQEGLLLPCDAALLAGECLVNESMLTGESVPVLKTPLPGDDRTYSSETERRHTLFCGTQIIQAKGGRRGGGEAIAVVTRTGFSTTKAFCGTIYIFVILSKVNVTWWEFIVRGLDIVTIVVPPALPVAITTGAIYAQSRLKKDG